MARPAALGPMQATAARQMRHTAGLLDADHPETVAGDHVRDAARLTETGRHDGAKRHLDAAMNVLTPQSLVRHGIKDDEGHATAKHHLHQVHRHLLTVQDIEDTRTRNDEIRTAMRAARGQISATDTQAAAGPPQPGHAPPARQQPGQPPVGLASRVRSVIDLRSSTAWLHERRGPNGEWTSGGGVYHGGGALPAVGYKASPLGRKVSKREAAGYQAMMAAMDMQPSLHGKPAGFFGTKGSVFGRHLSPAEAHGAAEALAPKPASEYKGGILPGQMMQFQSLSKAQKVIYHKLIKRGRAHAGAFVIARAFKPGMLESAVLANRLPAIDLAFWQRELRAPSGKWMKAGDAASLDGSLAHGVTRRGDHVRGYYNHVQGTITARGGGKFPVAFVRPTAHQAPRIRFGGKGLAPYDTGSGTASYREAFAALRHPRTKLRPAASLASSSLGALLMASAHGRHIPGTPFTYKHGWARIDSQDETGRFGAGLLPGSFEHINAIEDLAGRAGAGSGDPGRRSPTMRTALHNVARAVGGRDMRRARVHLDAARWANQREAGGYYSRDLRDLRRQLEHVPAGVTGWEGKIKNPLTPAGQHPGKYLPSLSLRPPAHPAGGARQTAYQAYSNATELAGPYRFKHGWIRLLDAGSATEAAAGGTGMPLGLTHRQHTVYRKLRARRMPHGKAMALAGRIGRGVGKALDAGSATKVLTQFSNVDLSARTAMLERTPAPRGKPGGPGLYDVKGQGHTAYFQQVVKALIEKRGMPASKAYAIAYGALRKWRRGGGHVHPEVRAAATGALAGEAAKIHGHAVTAWDIADHLVELACEPIELFNPYHAPTGQFTTQQGAGAGQGKQTKAQQRKTLTRKIAGLRAQIATLRGQLPKPRKSKSATPAKRGAAATSAKQAAQAKATAAKAGKATVKTKTLSPATIHAKIAALEATLRADIAQLRALH